MLDLGRVELNVLSQIHVDLVVTASIPWFEAVFRLFLAIALGACIGWERQSEHKPAGLRTHMLVSLGSALFILTSLNIESSAPVTPEPSRVIQGVITGVGFLGAGEIFSKSSVGTGEMRIRGLTSAAAVWLSAALGVAAGMGYWVLGVSGAVMALLILWGVKKVE